MSSHWRATIVGTKNGTTVHFDDYNAKTRDEAMANAQHEAQVVGGTVQELIEVGGGQPGPYHGPPVPVI